MNFDDLPDIGEALPGDGESLDALIDKLAGWHDALAAAAVTDEAPRSVVNFHKITAQSLRSLVVVNRIHQRQLYERAKHTTAIEQICDGMTEALQKFLMNLVQGVCTCGHAPCINGRHHDEACLYHHVAKQTMTFANEIAELNDNKPTH